MTRDVPIETPGDVATPVEAEVVAVAPATEAATTDAAPGAAAGDALPTDPTLAQLAAAPVVGTDLSPMQKEQILKAQLEVTAKLVGSSDALDWSHLNQGDAVKKDYSPIEEGLPDQAEIDPDTIKVPMLSKQGWVLPKNDPRDGRRNR